MTEYYLWIKSFHVIAVISWMCGLLYLPRLFVYHCKVPVGSDQDKMFQLMERKLLRIIINPAMIIAFILGLMLIHIDLEEVKEGYWFLVKTFFLIIMFACHGIMAVCRKKFERGINNKSEKFYRILNEVPAVAMIVIVIMVMVHPF